MNIERINMKYFYTTGSICTSSLAVVNSCISQSTNNTITKYQISSSGVDRDFYVSSSLYTDMTSTRMSEAVRVKEKDVPIITVEYFGSQGELGMEITRLAETDKLKWDVDYINSIFNEHSSSGV
tara:strand:+ start:650 stop:1021 length:372 start_codon:yes stop_codon:yes gene_type:complete